MPSSGARSGTKPSRPEPAGDGSPEGLTALRCGHVSDSEPVIVYPAQKRRYWCESCRSLVAAK